MINIGILPTDAVITDAKFENQETMKYWQNLRQKASVLEQRDRRRYIQKPDGSKRIIDDVCIKYVEEDTIIKIHPVYSEKSDMAKYELTIMTKQQKPYKIMVYSEGIDLVEAQNSIGYLHELGLLLNVHRISEKIEVAKQNAVKSKSKYKATDSEDDWCYIGHLYKKGSESYGKEACKEHELEYLLQDIRRARLIDIISKNLAYAKENTLNSILNTMKSSLTLER